MKHFTDKDVKVSDIIPMQAPNIKSDRAMQGKEQPESVSESLLIEKFGFKYDGDKKKFEEEAECFFDRPSLPLCFQTGLYDDILKIRMSNNEDEKIAAQAQRFIKLGESGGLLERKEFIFMVSILMSSYPLLHNRHMNVFEDLRQAAIIFNDQNAGEFRLAMLITTGFLSPNRDLINSPPEYQEEYLNPIPALDVLYTLRIWNLRAPFNCLIFPKSRLDAVESYLLRNGLAKDASSEPGVPYYVREYIRNNSRP